MSYKLKCSCVGCTRVASYIDSNNQLFCQVHTTRAESIKYGGEKTDLRRLDDECLRLQDILTRLIPLQAGDPEMVTVKARDAIAQYFKDKGEDDIAKLVKGLITY